MLRQCTWKEELPNIKSMIDQNISLKDIGEHYGVSRQRIYQILTKYGIETPVRKRKNFLRGKPSKHYWFSRMLCSKGFSKEDRHNMLFNTELPDHCPILGIKLNYDGTNESKSGYSGRMDNSPSIDRIDSNKGYTADNIHVISWRANRIKNDSTVEELRLLANYMEKMTS